MRLLLQHAHFILSVFLIGLSLCHCVRDDDGLINAFTGLSLIDDMGRVRQTREHIRAIERAHNLPAGWFTRVVGRTDDGTRRAITHIRQRGSRFSLLMPPGDPSQGMFYSVFSIVHPQTRSSTLAVMMIQVISGQRGELIGEAHFPQSLTRDQAEDAQRLLEEHAEWYPEEIARRFGMHAVNLEPPPHVV
ncbi:uncharacterized protein SRS1_10075 [Sporisorium reilianum f. sp. reilianum]|uniref:Uncharacterized protein n=1 Tax=Sporisorium reilianum f. sp. reilianum TaxID=72559 RepID=A0A2N8ULE7_9BASI|nr:uncharacterized protein SRS1_10075 [Sporisorium reilianum f. sp. reilianum]